MGSSPSPLRIVSTVFIDFADWPCWPAFRAIDLKLQPDSSTIFQQAFGDSRTVDGAQATTMAAQSMLSTFAQLVGLLWLSYASYHMLTSVWIYLVRPSSLPRYLHAKPASWALVTGASDGIGRSIAEELLKRGFNVLLHGRNEKKLSDLRAKLLQAHSGRRIELLVLDASRPGIDYDAIVSQIKALDGKLTILVNNVGGIPTSPKYLPIDKVPGEDLDICMAINTQFPTRLTAALLPLLKANKPSLILNCGSNAGEIGVPYITAYSGTKAYVHVLTLALRSELQAQKVEDVEVMCILIGNTTTAGNTTQVDGGTITADQCAKGMLDRVGCKWRSPNRDPWRCGNADKM